MLLATGLALRLRK